MTDPLTRERIGRLRLALSNAPFDAFLAVSAANILDATGYRSMGASVFGQPTMGAFVTGDRTVVAAPVADAAPATAEAIEADDFVPYGRFFFESASDLPAAFTPDLHGGIVEAMTAAAKTAGLTRATIGVDEVALNPNVLAQLSLALPAVRFVDASGWAVRTRSRKLPAELELLERACHLAEDGIAAAIDAAEVGMNEIELATVVNGVITSGGGEPRFTVVSSGPRSAFADVFPTARKIAAGDLLRFDVGCIVQGYWSDIGRTAVIGAPNDLQAKRYQAIRDGEEQQLAAVKAGVTAAEMFQLAVDTVEANGLAPYRRQHCGHGIGMDVYEAPVINGTTDRELEAGMTFCFETPYYEVGWGGMMVEDTLVVTAEGHRRFTRTDRELRVVPV